MGEHVEEKLDMLNAVLFDAATHVPDEVSDLWTSRYLRWADGLEPQHRRAPLRPGSSGSAQGSRGRSAQFMSGPRSEVLELASSPFPEEQMELILEDLRAFLLGDVGSEHAPIGHGVASAVVDLALDGVTRHAPRRRP